MSDYFTPSDNDSSEHIEEGIEAGVWRDHTTKKNRYANLAVKMDEKFDYDGQDSVSVLDVGSSDGRAVDFLADVFREKYGMETDVTSYDVGSGVLQDSMDKENVDDAVRGRAQQLPFQDDSFDMIVSKTLLSRISSQDQTEALNEIERVLNDDGIAGLEVDPYGKNLFTGLEYAFDSNELTEASNSTDEFGSYPFKEGLEKFR
jgi:ubiquinone/menaquinone biosynthesis C-methylase UbiE